MKVGVFAGTFDPITKGHEQVIKKSVGLFDKLIVALCVNPEKHTLYSVEDRLEMITAVCKGYKNVEVLYFDGMLVDLMKKKGIIYNVRGVRNSNDFEYENKMHDYNLNLYKEMVTIYLPCSDSLKEVSSTLARKSVNDNCYSDNLLSSEVIEIIKRINTKDNK